MSDRFRPALRDARTPAQWYCLLAGAALLLAGIFGFLADATFDTDTAVDTTGGGGLQGDSFLGFEVNGWHNVVHLLSGLALLAAANTRPTAKLVAIGFGFVYGLVALIGLIDGEDVLGFIPVNAADNLLHIALAVLGVAAGFWSPARRRRPAARAGSRFTRTPTPAPAQAPPAAPAEGPPPAAARRASEPPAASRRAAEPSPRPAPRRPAADEAFEWEDHPPRRAPGGGPPSEPS
jgi:hypothetical protein